MAAIEPQPLRSAPAAAAVAPATTAAWGSATQAARAWLANGILAFGIALVLLIAAALAPRAFGYGSYVVTGGSMEPTIPKGAVVVTRRLDPAELEVGDIATFAIEATPATLVTHRVVAIEGAGPTRAIRTRGDANGAVDTRPMDVSQPVARAVYWVPVAGYMVSYLSEPAGRILLIGFTLLLLWLRAQPRSRPPRRERAA